MKRIIKFRFWDGKKMYDWSWAKEYQIEHVFTPDMEVWGVLQFTGLLDKNGKEIYEGDIIRTGKSGYLRVVEWNTDRFNARWIIETQEAIHKENGLGMPLNIELYEVIGNIYENPELLNDNKDK